MSDGCNLFQLLGVAFLVVSAFSICEFCGLSPLSAASEEFLVVLLLGGLELYRRYPSGTRRDKKKLPPEPLKSEADL